MQLEWFDLPGTTKTPPKARIHRSPSFAQLRAINRAYRKNAEDEQAGDIDVMPKVILILVAEWSGVKGEEGTDLPLSEDGIDAAPAALISALWNEVQTVVNAALPNR